MVLTAKEREVLAAFKLARAESEARDSARVQLLSDAAILADTAAWPRVQLQFDVDNTPLRCS